MRKLGLLGGTSWESTVEYYRLLNQGVRERMGGLHSARLVLDSIDFAPMADLQKAGNWDEAGRQLATGAQGLQAAGAEAIAICANTMHLVAPQVAAAVDVPLLDLLDAVADAVKRASLATVGLLGTAFTMEHGFYADGLARRGVATRVPVTDDRALVHRVIYDELCQGVVSEQSRAALRDVIERLVGGGAEGVILGCTELELLITQADSSVPVFPTTRLHVDQLLDWALA